ncbi:MAG: hypothetical protein WBE76_23660 [Terracidiphilus sp.]
MNQRQGKETGNHGTDPNQQVVTPADASSAQNQEKPDKPNPQGNNPTQKIKHPRNTLSRKTKRYLLKLSREGPDRHIELVLALVIAVFAYMQWHTARSNSDSTAQQTEQLITAAKISAVAAQQNAAAASSFSDSARKIDQGIGNAVDRLNLQAQATSDVANATQAQAASTASLVKAGQDQADNLQRQVIDFEAAQAARLIVELTPLEKPGVLKATAGPNDSISIDWDIKATNVGPTIARELNFSGDTYEVAGTDGGYAEPPGHPFSKLVPVPKPAPFGFAIGPNKSEDFAFIQDIPDWATVSAHKASIIIIMQVSYIDIFNKAQAVPDCFYYNIESNGFVQCPFIFGAPIKIEAKK